MKPMLCALCFSTVIALGVAFASINAGSDIRGSLKKDLECDGPQTQTGEAKFSNYLIRTYRSSAHGLEGCVQVFKNTELVFSRGSTHFEIGNHFYESKGGPEIPIGTDITGAGQPNAIVSEWSGGAHCCFTMHVFELGERFREIAQIKAEHSDGAHFVDLDGDGYYEFEGNDWVFAYWRTSFMESPAPRIVLKYRGGRFRLAFDLMRRPALSHDEFAKTVSEIRDNEAWPSKRPSECAECTPVLLWSEMLDLIYGGNSAQAWQLFDESWPCQVKGKRKFAQQFCIQLKSSHYWADLKSEIGPCPR